MQLELLTDDKRDARVCEDYWKFSENGKFLFQVKEVAKIHDMQRLEVSLLVKEYSYVWTATDCCRACNKPYRYKNRSEYQERQKLRRSVCKDCADVEYQAVVDRKKIMLLEFRQVGIKSNSASTPPDLKSTIYLLATLS